MVHGGHMTVDQKPDVMRERLRTLNILDPLNWTQCTIEQGVLWLNTSLTMVPNEDLAPHTSFWSQVMHEIIRHIFAAKAAKAGPSGCVFVLWGVVAQKLEKRLRAIGAEFNVPVRVVVGPNPAVEEVRAAAATAAAYVQPMLTSCAVQQGTQLVRGHQCRARGDGPAAHQVAHDAARVERHARRRNRCRHCHYHDLHHRLHQACCHCHCHCHCYYDHDDDSISSIVGCSSPTH